MNFDKLYENDYMSCITRIIRILLIICQRTDFMLLFNKTVVAPTRTFPLKESEMSLRHSKAWRLLKQYLKIQFMSQIKHMRHIKNMNRLRLTLFRMFSSFLPLLLPLGVSLQILNVRVSVGLLEREISPCKAATYQKHRINAKHPILEWDSNPRSQCSKGRRHFVS
jgi:hypothetical protein